MILEVKNVVKRYADKVALDDVSLSVGEGKIFGLLGPNGAGKTTLIRIINQITAPDSGEVLFMGRELNREDISKIGYLPEERGLYRKMKVGEQCLYLARLKGMSKDDAMKQLKIWFEKFGIIDWWNKKIEELSKGMAQKIQFIVTLIHRPNFLIFDEPFSGFDPVNVNLLTDVILDLKKNGTTLILSTHNMASVEALCDDIVLINKSKVILNGSVHDVINRYKENIFEIGLNKAVGEDFLRTEGFNVTGVKNGEHGAQLTVKLNDGFNSGDLLRHILTDKSIQVLSFREKLPTMNDIFINLVQTK